MGILPDTSLRVQFLSLLLFVFFVLLIREISREFFTESNNVIQPNSYIVSYVIDGDTIVLDSNERIRLLGVDAAEVSTNECFSREAKDYLIRLINGKKVYLESDYINKDKDKYGRLLRYVMISSQNINLLLIQDGYAQYYRRFPISKHMEFDKAEKEAKEMGRGLWGACNY